MPVFLLSAPLVCLNASQSNVCINKSSLYLGGYLKNIWFAYSARPTVFLGQKKRNTKICMKESENSNITVFENFRIISRDKTVTNTCLSSPKDNLSIYALLISIFFIHIGNSTGWINYSVRQDRNFMFALICPGL